MSDWLIKIKQSKSNVNKARALHVPKMIANKVNLLRDAAAVNTTRYKIGEVLKEAGCYKGRVAVGATGSFNITTNQTTIQGVSHQHCRVIHHQDGYQYDN